MTTTANDPAQAISQPPLSQNATHRDYLGVFIEVCLQISHRVATVGFLSLIVSWYLMFKVADYHLPLIIAAATADGAILFAAIALFCSRNRPKTRREARGLLIFTGIIFAVSIYTMIFTRMTWFRIELQPVTSAPPQVELPR
jgi:hypothetical protein